MARAKHTDRTEARRRYRAEQAALATETSGDLPESDAPTGRTGAKSPGPKAPAAKASSATPPERPGITAALRGAYRPVHFMDDLKALPQVVTNWGFLVAVGVTVVTAVAFVVLFSSAVSTVAVGDTEGLSEVIQANYLVYVAFSFTISPPPAAGAFLVGFTARGASWLGGLIYGAIGMVAIIVILATPAGRLLTGDGDPAQVVTQVAISPLGAMLFAAAAAWYRRFLNLASPNRAGRQASGKTQSKQKARPAAAKAGTRSR